MALFFDQQWFDERLGAIGATADDVARLLKLSGEQVREMWKDQRELRAADVQLLAGFLKVDCAEVAMRAGVSTPVPPPRADLGARLDEISDRLSRLERGLTELKVLVLARIDQSEADNH